MNGVFALPLVCTYGVYIKASATLWSILLHSATRDIVRTVVVRGQEYVRGVGNGRVAFRPFLYNFYMYIECAVDVRCTDMMLVEISIITIIVVIIIITIVIIIIIAIVVVLISASSSVLARHAE